MTDTVPVSRELLRQVIGAMIGVFNGEPITGMPIVKSVSALRAALDAEPLESVPQAMQTVIAAMQADPSYAWSWHCNVAMTYVDAGGDRYTGNQGAARFMKLLANVDPAHELPEKPAPAQEPVAFVSLDDLDAMCNPEYAPGAHFRMRKTPAGKYVQPIYTAPQAQQPSPPADMPMLTDEELREAFAQSLTSTYVCGRVWGAWGYGTMSEDDFSPASECDELLDSLVQAVRQKAGLK